MSTTAKQDEAFLRDVIGTGTLENAIDWIRDNMSFDDVFPQKELIKWASDFDPEDIFPESSLSAWAESNGYVKE